MVNYIIAVVMYITKDKSTYYTIMNHMFYLFWTCNLGKPPSHQQSLAAARVDLCCKRLKQRPVPCEIRKRHAQIMTMILGHYIFALRIP